MEAFQYQHWDSDGRSMSGVGASRYSTPGGVPSCAPGSAAIDGQSKFLRASGQGSMGKGLSRPN